MSIDVLPPDGGVVKVPGGGLLIAGGLAVPADGSTGYSSGCVFHHIDGAAGTMLYLNEGTVNSCAFKRVLTAARFSAVSTSQLTAEANYDGGDSVNKATLTADIFELFNQVNALTLAVSGL